jgi:hypothetical protein
MRKISFIIIIIAAVSLLGYYFFEQKNINMINDGYSIARKNYEYALGKKLNEVKFTDNSDLVFVASQYVSCSESEDLSQECLLIDGAIFAGQIIGFNYIPGFEYVLKVEKNNPQEYTLIEVISENEFIDVDIEKSL